MIYVKCAKVVQLHKWVLVKYMWSCLDFAGFFQIWSTLSSQIFSTYKRFKAGVKHIFFSFYPYHKYVVIFGLLRI
jgi:hypothetical protein